MRTEVLQALRDTGLVRSVDGTFRMYHATDRAAAAAILAEGVLRGREPEDLAQRMLRRDGGGSVFLSSSPSIGDVLVGAQVVLAMSLHPEDAPGAEVSRPAWGESPRVELEVMLPVGHDLPLTFADRLTRTTSREDLPSVVQRATTLFEGSDVGRQLADPAERRGRCGRASIRFVAALRECGTDGRLIEWAWGNDWHNAVLVGEDVIDWTASQFIANKAQISDMPQPLVETRTRVDLQLHAGHGAAAGIAFPADDPFFGRRVPLWEQAQQRIPDRDSQQQRHFKG